MDDHGHPATNHLPSETRPHAATFMGWPPAGPVRGEWTAAVREDVVAIARTIADHEPVVLLASPKDAAGARRACGGAAEVVELPVDDLWLRDSGPVFVTGEDGTLSGIDFGFNGWGGKQEHSRDGLVARRLLEWAGVPRIEAPLVAEGGSLETDGDGTLLVTESSLVNDNRNPGRSRDDIERTLTGLLGVRKVIWLPGVRGEDITDCHVDALARFAGPATVLLSRPPVDTPAVWTRVYEEARAALESATDAHGRTLEIIELPEPEPAALGRRGPDFLGSYVNYYVANGAVVVPRFGDRGADEEAASIIGSLHPGLEVRTVDISALAEGGGGIHCATQQRPAS
ncbi:agmatine deiminase family protein [Streptomyces abikoensis]|uniref:agmatine deiminase family protein n=1 Tax=Streptomyces abikoensis TaxID=97398 RepID=UPI0016740263|nr:agmatine deiminase family protein [Streptomyces abikoensis]GGP68219.1 porphyromonas-type peptidyl-arginine deiminase [Streptomyces abikoensis]